MFQLFGTIARKKKTLNNLMDTILKVCKKEISIAPKKIIYNSEIEKKIVTLEDKLKDIFSLPNYLLRWISLKILDGEPKILESIEKHFSVSIIDNAEINILCNKILDKLEQNNIISNNNFKDIIVSTIVKRSEAVCKTVCSFETKNYSRKR